MDKKKFQKILNKAQNSKIYGEDDVKEFMQFHPINLREGVFPFEKSAILTKKQTEELERVIDQKSYEFNKAKETRQKDSEEFHRPFKPIYWAVGIIILFIIIYSSFGPGPEDFSDTLRLDDARR